MICQACGTEAPTKEVTFYQNIGLLIMRLSKTAEGAFCKRCIHKSFWEMTLITLVAGWWGMISFLVTPFFLLNNIGRYVMCLGMPPAPRNAVPPTLTLEAAERIGPHAQALFQRLGAGQDVQAILREYAGICGVTPAQVLLFIRAAAAQSRAQ